MSGFFTLEIDGAPWGVSAVRGREAVGEPFSFEVVARTEEEGAIEIGLEAKLAWSLEDGSMRTVTAMVDAFEESGGAGEGASGRGATLIHLAPRLAALADSTDHKVFLEEDALAIAEAVLAAHALRLEPPWATSSRRSGSRSTGAIASSCAARRTRAASCPGAPSISRRDPSMA